MEDVSGRLTATGARLFVGCLAEARWLVVLRLVVPHSGLPGAAAAQSPRPRRTTVRGVLLGRSGHLEVIHLDLEHNSIGDDGFLDLCTATLAGGPQLRRAELSFIDNEITTRGLHGLAAMIRHHTLRCAPSVRLDLRRNALEGRVGDALNSLVCALALTRVVVSV